MAVLRRIRSGRSPRALAVLLVIAFTGAPRIAAGLAEAAHGGEHRCTCPARGKDHACSCPVCKSAARAAGGHDHGGSAAAAAADANVPPCHRKPTGERPPGVASAPEPAPLPDDVPCVQGACGDPLGPRAALTGFEPFVLAPSDAPVGPSPADVVAVEPLRPPGLAPAPDVPPPRA